MPLPAALSTRPGRTAETFSSFSALLALPGTPSSGGAARTSLDSPKNNNGFDHLQETKGPARLPVPPAHPCCVQKTG